MANPAYELYRRSSLGIALADALDELVSESHLEPQLAMKILSQFDSTIAEALHTKVKVRGSAKGHLHVYRFCDDVWTFIVNRPSFKLDGEEIHADKVKVARPPVGSSAPQSSQ